MSREGGHTGVLDLPPRYSGEFLIPLLHMPRTVKPLSWLRHIWEHLWRDGSAEQSSLVAHG